MKSMMYIKNVINLNLKLPPRNMIYLLSYYTKQSEKKQKNVTVQKITMGSFDSRIH